MWTTTPHGRSDLLRALGRALLLLSIAQAGAMFFGIRLNTTASLPIGFYIKSSSPNTNLVVFCPTGVAALASLTRGYRGAGACPDGGEPLLKPVVAKPGDLVKVSQEGIAINFRRLPNSGPRTRDSFGRGLTPWPYGAYTVAAGTVWVVSTYSSKSFDSRYFGPIEISSIRAHLAPLLTE